MAYTKILPLARGGTANVTATEAFDALAPLTTKGDIPVRGNASDAVRLPVGTDGYVLKANSSTATGLAWEADSEADEIATATFVTTTAETGLGNERVLTAGTAISITDNATNAVTVAVTTVPIANGGTGQTSAGAAFNALAPATAKGGLPAGTGSNAYGNLAVGANNTIVTADSSQATGLKYSHGARIGVSTVVFADSPFTAAANCVLLVNCTDGAITINLPAAASNTNKTYTIKKTDSSANAITIDGNSSETIDGATTFTISLQWDAFDFICDGSNWYVI